MTIKVNPTTNEVIITKEVNKVIVRSPGPQGPQGLIGPSGGSAYTLTAGEPISSYQVVVLIGGLVYVCDVTNLTHVEQFVGIAIQSATTGNSISIQYTGQVIGGAFTSGLRHFIGLGGLLTTNPNPVGALWTTIIGVAESSSSIILTPYQPILL